MTAFERFKISKFAWLCKFIFGVGLALGLPPLSQIWVATIALSLLYGLESGSFERPLRTHFLSGLSFGFGYFVFAFHWIGFAFLVDASSYLWMMPFAVGGLALFMASYWGVAFVLAHRLARNGFALWLTLPTSLALVEFLRGYLFTGFPWAAPGLMADGMGGVLQFASVVGMPGLTLLILLWGMLPFVILSSLHQNSRRLIFASFVLATLPTIWFWGEWRLQSHQTQSEATQVVRLVQPNISQSDKWRSENADAIFNELLELTSTPATQMPIAIIWPESAVSFLLDESETAKKQIAMHLQEGQTLLSGAIRRQIKGDQEDYFTSIIGFDHEGVSTGHYDKWRLVPGGEYLPLAWMLEPLGFRKVVSLPESFSAGRGPQNVEVSGLGQAAMLICYEAIFPHKLVPDGQRPRWIVNVTNDGWFGKSVGPYQHLAQVRMRSVEQGLPIARSANTGISAMIDPLGRVVDSLNLGDKGFVDVALPHELAGTFFADWGNASVAFVFVMMVFFGCWERKIASLKTTP